MRVLGAMGAFSRSIDRSIGWSRIGAVVSVIVLALALFTLWRLLKNIDTAKVWAALQATTPETIALAAVFVALGYLSITLYDYFALHTIGRGDVPYRTAAFASFTAFTIGHNLGATVFTAGAVRFRVYSAWGLSIIDVAKIAFITGLTFWLGNSFMLGGAMVYAPEAAGTITHLPAWANRSIGFLGLAVIVGYLAWLLAKPRVFGRGNWKLTLPDARLTFIQILIGILDLSAGALAMYVLLPATPVIELPALIVIFVAATLLGFLSHTPGSLGVFDAAMLIALTQYEKEPLVAALLTFRLMYFIIPFALAVLLLGAREIWFNARKAPEDQL
jgi:glycosyltransferase 2 family protein